MPDSDRNSLDGAGAMDDENLRQLEEQLVKSNHFLRYNPKYLRESAKAIQAGSEAGWRPSEAIRSDGQMHDSDINKGDMQGFFENMEGYRKREMVPPETLGATSDPEDERYFGEQNPDARERAENSNPDPGLEPGARRAHGIQSLEEKQGAPAGETPWIRRIPAAGRFGRTR